VQSEAEARQHPSRGRIVGYVVTALSAATFLLFLYSYLGPLSEDAGNGTENALGGAIKDFLVLPILFTGCVAVIGAWMLYYMRPPRSG
jgi:hypothetical protein